MDEEYKTLLLNQIAFLQATVNQLLAIIATEKQADLIELQKINVAYPGPVPSAK